MWPAAVTSTPNPSFFLFLPSNNKPSLFHPTPRRLHLSRSSPDFNGWALLETPARPASSNKGLSCSAVVTVGTSLALMLACFSLSRKGFNIQFTSPWQGMWSTVANTRRDPDEAVELYESNETTIEVVTETGATEKPGRVAIPVSVDSTQEEALSVLKKLKIIEDDVEANELCTRREFARWLVKLNSSLERDPKHRIAPIVSLSGSIVTAFDDINVDDPDFQSIQVLAEAGMVHSKLSWKNSSNGCGSDWKEDIHFFPDRFISRQDLMEWRTQVEYGFFSGIIDQISIEKAGYMDVKEITSAGVYLDMLAGDSSILRKVFGQSKRFQPSKPSTNAQAAVALTSGRMNEVISAEMSRLEAEGSARQDVAKEIRSELLSRGDIQKFWDAKLSEEKNHGSGIERLYLEAVNNLVEEKFNQEKINAEFLKEQAEMDCQKQMMLSLKKEVDEISDKLALERVIYVVEKKTVQKLLRDLELKHEEILDTKSTLEAEKEALQMLRTWVEDEARRSQARAAVLSEVGRRWKWDDQA
ncbi:unnamed protein product [Lathyrus oleraceus]|uniref:SLH domain-containing protein n=2 Tax=Pisum sativum TaxID=3888 RepID=A0A9D4YFH8_PEA|nr:uncharacterized protein LOC127119171 [Pisum sativum]KAI5436585.1 hypothetical protein KIW84_022914 [Pisum sativum]